MSGKEHDPAMHVVQFDGSLRQASVELFMRAFSKPPWNDVFESEEEVTGFFHAFLAWPNFRGFHLLSDEGQVTGLSVGFTKPWLKEGRLRYEYFIDQFCIDPQSSRARSQYVFSPPHRRLSPRGQHSRYDPQHGTILPGLPFLQKKTEFADLADFGFLVKEL